MKQTIRLTESELRRMVKDAVAESLNEDMQEEGFWNQMKTGAKTFMNKDTQGQSFSDGIKNRWSAAKKNYQTQGQMDQMDDLKGGMEKVKQQLQQMLDSGLLTPQTTVEQILSNQTKFNSFSGKRANLQGQINRRMR